VLWCSTSVKFAAALVVASAIGIALAGCGGHGDGAYSEAAVDHAFANAGIHLSTPLDSFDTAYYPNFILTRVEVIVYPSMKAAKYASRVKAYGASRPFASSRNVFVFLTDRTTADDRAHVRAAMTRLEH
jgi:hypothetical protein